MPLLRRILRRNCPIELTDQFTHLIGGDWHGFDQDLFFSAHHGKLAWRRTDDPVSSLIAWAMR
jgi:hypothetical protein